MSKRFILLLLTVFSFMAVQADEFDLYVSVPDNYTNVRNAPNGKVVGTLHSDDMVLVDRCQNGWFHLSSSSYIDSDGNDSTLGGGDNLWIHGSVLSVGWVEREGPVVVLRDAPSSKGKVVVRSVANQSTLVTRVLDMKGSWLKVRLASGKQGWAHHSILCGNSLTTCN